MGNNDIYRLIDSILRTGGGSIDCSGFGCDLKSIKEEYENRGWSVLSEGSVLRFTPNGKRVLLKD